MTNPLYARLQATANRLITKYGQVGAIKHTTPPDPVFGGDGMETVYPAKLVPMTYDQRFVDGTNIRSSDRQIYISSVGLAVTPVPSDVVSVGGVDYLIVAGDPNNYDGVTSVVYIVQGRV